MEEQDWRLVYCLPECALHRTEHKCRSGVLPFQFKEYTLFVETEVSRPTHGLADSPSSGRCRHALLV
jgi:hypothetical protein